MEHFNRPPNQVTPDLSLLGINAACRIFCVFVFFRFIFNNKAILRNAWSMQAYHVAYNKNAKNQLKKSVDICHRNYLKWANFVELEIENF